MKTQRVKQCVDTVEKVLADDALMKLHAREIKSGHAHLRIRVGVLLDRAELAEVRAHLQSKSDQYPRCKVENTSWSSKWLRREKGVEMMLYYHPGSDLQSRLPPIGSHLPHPRSKS